MSEDEKALAWWAFYAGACLTRTALEGPGWTRPQSALRRFEGATKADFDHWWAYTDKGTLREGSVRHG